MGQRILRREDSRFLLGTGNYVENIDAPGCAPRHVRPFAVRPRARPRRRRLGGSGSAGDAGVHSLGRRPGHVPAASVPGSRSADGATLPGGRGRPIRGRHRRRRRHRVSSGGRRCRRARRRGLRPAAGRGRPRAGARRRGVALPRSRAPTSARVTQRSATSRCSTTATWSFRGAWSASGWRRARSSRDRARPSSETTGG